MNNQLLDKLFQTAIKQEIPFQGQFELTNRCNFQCKMCYLNGGAMHTGIVMPASFWLKQAEEAKKLGLFVLSISGGESFVYPELDELMEGLCKMGFLLSFNTNGSLIHQKGIDWFLKYPVTKINISLYGASNETYQKLCGCGPKEFDHVLEAIDGLLANQFNVYLTALMTPQNIGDLPKMKQIAKDRGLELHIASYTHPSFCKEIYRFDPITQSQYAYSYILSNDTSSLHNARGQLAIKEKLDPNLLSFQECNGAKNSFAISHDGKLMPCVMMRHIQSDLTTHSFQESWEEVKEEMKQAQVPTKCQKCKYANTTCPACKGSLHREEEINGNIDYLCSMAKETTRIIQEGKDDDGSNLPNSSNSNLYSCSI